MGRDGPLDAESREEDYQQDARQDARKKELIDPYLCNDGVDDKGEARWEEQTQRSRGGQYPEREFLRVFPLEQGGEKDTPQCDDCEAGGTGQCGKDGAADQGNDRQPAGEPAQDCIVKPYQPFGCPAFRQEISGKGEEGNGHEYRRCGHAVHLDDHGRRVDLACEKEIEGEAGDDGEDRSSQE